MVNKVYSDHTQLQYAYYELPFVCPPTGQSHGAGLLSGQSIPLNLGEVLRGDRITTSDINLQVSHDSECNILCHQNITRADLTRAKSMIEDGYVVEWIVDNLPGATSFVTVDKTRKYYAAGFKLGYTEISGSTGSPRYYLNNHHTIVIRWRKAPGSAGEKGGKVVVGFEVYPKSVGAHSRNSNTGCPKDLQNVEENFELYIPPIREDVAHKYPDSSYIMADNEIGEDGATINVPYTYSVYWREDETVEWSNRWDLYFVNQEDGSHIHWVAIANSLIICALLTGMVLIIFAKTIRKDIKAGYKESVLEGGKRRRRSKPHSPKRSGEKLGGMLEQPDEAATSDSSSDEDALEDVTGWKLLHSDVFRTPQYGYLLAPLVGSGMQLLFMTLGLVLLSAVGVLNLSFRGGFISVGVGLFVFAGTFSGLFSAKVFKSFDGRDWQKNAFVTAILFPGLAFGLIFILNLFVWAQASSTAIPFTTLVGMLVLWLFIQVPLVYVGAWAGFEKTAAWEHPTKATTIPRQIPPQAWYMKSVRSVLIAGLIPFAVIFIELLFMFNSVWQDKSGYYYMFGFLAVVVVILMVTVAEVTVVTIYVQLCAENYHWWWQSFAVGGGSAVWVFLYCVWYYFARLHITGFVSSLLFFSYSFMACCVYALLTGTVGFLSANAFVRRIYG
ncbi:multispanning membrane [Zalerion maritima]|uniref:Transmembrane 9 superfamily member n=1 Tax=Zalerion maritima TaxID=339359 RepID=A0AAD5RUI7_9PEZI|nr:multispanning membrane [Zalerion maritima]